MENTNGENRIWNKSELEQMPEWVEDKLGDWQHSFTRCWITKGFIGKPIESLTEGGYPVLDEMIAKTEIELVQEAVTQANDKLKERLDKGEIGITLENGTIIKVGEKYTKKGLLGIKWLEVLDIGYTDIWTINNYGGKYSYPITDNYNLFTEPKEEPKTLEETWTKTMDLRWCRIMNSKTLQQKQISNLGIEKWVDIETVVL